MTKVNDLKLTKSIFKKAKEDDNIVTNVEPHPTGVSRCTEYRRWLKAFITFREEDYNS